MTKQRYKITLSYDGSAYSGWQVQPNALSIQLVIEKALYKITHERVAVIGSGRTDAGVHAEHQVAHFSLENPIATALLLRSLNGTLPKDIRIKKIEKVDETFHARYSAKGKVYAYYLCIGPAANPLSRHYSYYVSRDLNIEAMKKAAGYLLGKHDFRAFANKANQGSALKNPVKTLRRLEISKTSDGIQCTFEADGFLYKMVRNIVGALLAVGYEKISPEDLQTILASKDRRKTPMAAPAKGLFLKHVYYD